MDDKWQALSRPFLPSEIEWRFQRAGISNGKPWAMVLAYISFPAVVKRFNEVFGPGNWQNDHQVTENGAYICWIGVKNDDGEWVWKSNGSDETKVEAVKGGFSTALKRTAAMWGVGLYLYGLGDSWAIFDKDGQFKDKIQGDYYRWNPPALPDWALPLDEVKAKEKIQNAERNDQASDSKKQNEAVKMDALGWFSKRFKNLRSGSTMTKAVKQSIEDKTLNRVFRSYPQARDLLQQKWNTLKDAGKIEIDFGVFLIDQGFTPPRAEVNKEHVPVTPEDVAEVFGKPTVPQPLAAAVQKEMDTMRAGMGDQGQFINWETFDKFLSLTAKQQEITREALIKKMVTVSKSQAGAAIMLKAMSTKYLTYLEKEFISSGQ